MGVNGHHEPRRGCNGTVCNGSVRPLDHFGDVDPWTAWAYKPRTISLLLMGTCFLMWVHSLFFWKQIIVFYLSNILLTGTCFFEIIIMYHWLLVCCGIFGPFSSIWTTIIYNSKYYLADAQDFYVWWILFHVLYQLGKWCSRSRKELFCWSCFVSQEVFVMICPLLFLFLQLYFLISPLGSELSISDHHFSLCHVLVTILRRAYELICTISCQQGCIRNDCCFFGLLFSSGTFNVSYRALYLTLIIVLPH